LEKPASSNNSSPIKIHNHSPLNFHSNKFQESTDLSKCFENISNLKEYIADEIKDLAHLRGFIEEVRKRELCTKLG
jgi:hypothetical protein